MIEQTISLPSGPCLVIRGEREKVYREAVIIGQNGPVSGVIQCEKGDSLLALVSALRRPICDVYAVSGKRVL